MSPPPDAAGDHAPPRRTKKIKVSFFSLESEEDVAAAVRRTFQLPVAQRNAPHDGGQIRLRQLLERDGLLCGDMVRINLHEPIMLARLDGAERSITDRADDEGLGNPAAFIYCPRKKRLAYQSNRGAVSASQAVRYLARQGGLQDPPVVQVQLRPEIDQALKAMQQVRLFSFKAKPIILDREDADLMSVFGGSSFAYKVGARQVEFNLTMGRQRKTSMLMETVREKITKLLGWRKDQLIDLTKLKVSGSAEHSAETEVLDLIHADYHQHVQVTTSILPAAYFENRLSGLLDAWSKAERDLKS